MALRSRRLAATRKALQLQRSLARGLNETEAALVGVLGGGQAARRLHTHTQGLARDY